MYFPLKTRVLRPFTLKKYFPCLESARTRLCNIFLSIIKVKIPPNISTPWGGGHEIYNSCLLTLQVLHTKFGQHCGLVVLEKKMLLSNKLSAKNGLMGPL